MPELILSTPMVCARGRRQRDLKDQSVPEPQIHNENRRAPMSQLNPNTFSYARCSLSRAVWPGGGREQARPATPREGPPMSIPSTTPDMVHAQSFRHIRDRPKARMVIRTREGERRGGARPSTERRCASAGDDSSSLWRYVGCRGSTAGSRACPSSRSLTGTV